MKHILYMIIIVLACSCGTTKSQGVIKNSDSTPPPEGFVPFAPPVIIEGSPEDYMDKSSETKIGRTNGDL